ncbi:MAG: alpha/beta fold hydrolase [Candidatus Omnitrophota bacterium]
MTAILIHGLTGTPNEVRFLANFLHKKGYSVFCPRLANHGEPLHILKKTKWPEFYESVRKVFLGIKQSGNCGPIYVAGLSMGALLALLLASEFPSDIAGVCCLSPTLFYDGWNIPWTKCLLPLAAATPLKYISYFKEEPPYGIKNEAIRQRVHEFYKKAELDKLNGVAKYGYPFFPVTLLCELNQLIKHLIGRLPAIETPVQCIQAKNDDMTSVKNSQFICDRIKSSIKEIFLLYNSYHVITADFERETVAEEMDSFFTRLRSGFYSSLLTGTRAFAKT